MADITLEQVMRQINEGLEMARKSGVVCGEAFNVKIIPPSGPKSKA